MNRTAQPGKPAWLQALLTALLCFCIPAWVSAQSSTVLNMATLEGQELTPDNVFSYTIQSNAPATVDARIKGKLTYRATGQSFSYTYSYKLRQGMNVIEPSLVHPQWTFSSTALRELFLEYKKLPAGTYEYCVEIIPYAPGGELVSGGDDHDCIFGKVDELFLINLLDPENNAKLHENYPVLSWMVNYPFASALTYKLRVAEVKEGQNNTAAINRNNPIYQESNIMQTTLSYPVYAKALEKFVPYAWTVDAYYKGILLGGAEPWRFTIVDDSLMKGVPRESYFVDIRKEHNETAYYAVGVIKFKYVLDELMKEDLSVQLTDKNGKSIKLPTAVLKATLGDNPFEIDLKEQGSLKHLGIYNLIITNSQQQQYQLPIRYVNPDFL